jgi:hypothetical protein
MSFIGNNIKHSQLYKRKLFMVRVCGSIPVPSYRVSANSNTIYRVPYILSLMLIGETGFKKACKSLKQPKEAS